MLNIENYEEWVKVCDDDELIQNLYTLGIRPGTEQFVELLGKPYEGDSGNSKATLILIGGIAVTGLIVGGSVKAAKFIGKKIKKRIDKSEEIEES